MKYSDLFISAGICFILVSHCRQAQGQNVSANSDVVWKATVSYCVTNEITDRYDGAQCDIYNFNVIEQSGSLRKLINLLYDSAFASKTYPQYAMDLQNNLNPMILLSQKDEEDIVKSVLKRTDNAQDKNGHLNLVETTIDASHFSGLTVNHEWMYNSKTRTLKSTITDATLNLPVISRRDPRLLPGFWGTQMIESVGGFKFSNRSNDSGGIGQEVLKPEIAWGMEMLLPIAIDSINGPRLGFLGGGSLQEDTANGKHSKVFHTLPIPIKTTFNKKLVEWIWEASRKGVVPSYYYVGEDKIGEQIPVKDLKKIGLRIDTVKYHDGRRVVDTNEVNADQLSGMEMREEISFNRSTFSFKSKITYAGIMIYDIDKNHNVSKTLYWVKLN